MSEHMTVIGSHRKTVVVANSHALRWQRLQAARARQQGTQAMLFEQLAARLAGGFCRAADGETLMHALRDALQTVDMGELDGIRTLPGTPAALLATLGKCWTAGIDLQARRGQHSRLAALANVEQAVLERLPIGALAPPSLQAAAMARIAVAPAVLGVVTVLDMPDLAPCWRPLLLALAEVTPVRWQGGAFEAPTWLQGSRVEVARASGMVAPLRQVSTANAGHEVEEALRWAHDLVASGRARPEEVALVAVNPADYDDAMQTGSQALGLDLHFVHGRPLAATREGQHAAALADILQNGLTLRRLRRLDRLAEPAGGKTMALPRGWLRALPERIALRSAGSWQRALDAMTAADWPDGDDQTAELRLVVEALLGGTAAANELGAQFLGKRARAIWYRALLDGPANALLATIGAMRQDDGIDSCAHVCWMPASVLASAPRRFVWLLGLNAGTWPRRSKEDSLLPGHVIAASELEPEPLGLQDRRNFYAICVNATEVMLSRVRRDKNGRLASPSHLLPEGAPVDVRQQPAPPALADAALAHSTRMVWRNWHADQVTAHDGLVQSNHPLLAELATRVHSASSLKSLLRNPLGHLWQYGLQWREPEAGEETLALEPSSFGRLVHAIGEKALRRLESGASLASANPGQLQAALDAAVQEAAAEWERAEAIPPGLLWQRCIGEAKELARRALLHRRGEIPLARAYAEVPFGGADTATASAGALPWDASQPVPILDTGLLIKGVIDRIDVAPDGKSAIVRDYKTGAAVKTGQELGGGTELQRSLYALAAHSLLPGLEQVEASMYFARSDSEAVLDGHEEVLERLAGALKASHASLLAGRTVPGIDAAGQYDDFLLLLPANAAKTYTQRKNAAIAALLGEAAAIWEMK